MSNKDFLNLENLKNTGDYLNEYEELDPYWVTGFVDADGSFGVYKRKLSFKYDCSFRISQDKVDKNLLLIIQRNLGTGGSISESNKGMVNYSISSILDINKIVIPFFKQYKLKSSKQIDFESFKKIISIINNKGLGKKWTLKDHEKILLLTSNMNKARRNSKKIFHATYSKNFTNK